jgi:hypothetical protein
VGKVEGVRLSQAGGTVPYFEKYIPVNFLGRENWASAGLVAFIPGMIPGIAVPTPAMRPTSNIGGKAGTSSRGLVILQEYLHDHERGWQICLLCLI